MNETAGEKLSAILKERTRALHAVAERSGVMVDLVAGRLSLHGYCVLLRNLHAIYEALESGLDQSVADGRLWRPELRRLQALTQDLDHLHAGDWQADLPLVPTAVRYAARLTGLVNEAPGLLRAHAYVRYLGDLHGGQMLSGMIRLRYGLEGPTGTAFYAFGDRAQVEALKVDFRDGLDALPLTPPQRTAFVEEACDAFRLHQRLFEELRA